MKILAINGNLFRTNLGLKTRVVERDNEIGKELIHNLKVKWNARQMSGRRVD